MNQLTTTAIVLSRTEYGEADRILTLLTPDHGKLRLMAKGVRRLKSKLAGGIELFSVSNITFIKGRGDMGTLISARLLKHYGRIVTDLERTMLGYELIKQLNKITEDETEQFYFELLQQAFAALDDASVPVPIIRWWFAMQLLRQGGHAPNLQTDTAGHKLDAAQTYDFSFDDMAFVSMPGRGHFNANHIKFLRLGFSNGPPKLLAVVRGSAALIEACAPLIQTLLVSGA